MAADHLAAGTLTSFAAMIVVLVTMRLNEERAEREAA